MNSIGLRKFQFFYHQSLSVPALHAVINHERPWAVLTEMAQDLDYCCIVPFQSPAGTWHPPNTTAQMPSKLDAFWWDEWDSGKFMSKNLEIVVIWGYWAALYMSCTDFSRTTALIYWSNVFIHAHYAPVFVIHGLTDNSPDFPNILIPVDNEFTVGHIIQASVIA